MPSDHEVKVEAQLDTLVAGLSNLRETTAEQGVQIAGLVKIAESHDHAITRLQNREVEKSRAQWAPMMAIAGLLVTLGSLVASAVVGYVTLVDASNDDARRELTDRNNEQHTAMGDLLTEKIRSLEGYTREFARKIDQEQGLQWEAWFEQLRLNGEQQERLRWIEKLQDTPPPAETPNAVP